MLVSPIFALRTSFTREATPIFAREQIHSFAPSSLSAVPRAVDSGAPPTAKAVAEALSWTHQMDALPATQWDRTRCMAASSVAITAFCGVEALRRLAQSVREEIRQRHAAIEDARLYLSLGDPDLAREARQTILRELQAHIDSFGFDLRLTADVAGWQPCDRAATGGAPETGVLVVDNGGEGGGFVAFTNGDGQSVLLQPVSDDSSDLRVCRGDQAGWPEIGGGDAYRIPAGAFAAADIERIDVPVVQPTIPWLRWLDEGTDHVRLATVQKESTIAPAALQLALHQAMDRESELIDRIADALDAELFKLDATLASLNRPGMPAAETLQRLADSMLFARQRTSRGMNAFYAVETLGRTGLDARLLERPVPFDEMASAVSPGQALLITGIGHACAFGRSVDGRTWLYDSEGIGGDPGAPCVVFVDPERADEAIRQRYGKFSGVARISPRSSIAMRISALLDRP